MPVVAGLFFPLREALGFDAREFTPRVMRKIAVLAAEVRSFHRATICLQEADISVCSKTVQRVVHEVGHELAARRDSKKSSQRLSQPVANVPALAVVECDGGRIRTREPGHGPGGHADGIGGAEAEHACLIRATHRTFMEDPQPDPPDCFLDPKHVAKIVENAALSVASITPTRDETLGQNDTEVDHEAAPPPPLAEDRGLAEETVDEAAPAPALDVSDGPQLAPASELEQTLDQADWRPKRLVRTVVSSLSEAKTFGTQMKREATARRFFEAPTKAFLGDGLPWNWSIWKKQFSTFTPILDFIHPLSSLFTAAKAVHPESNADAWDQYQVWMTGCWRGEVVQVIEELKTWQERLGPPEKETPATAPRVVVKTTQRNLTSNPSRMKYAEYRTHGLPVTTAWMESLVKEMNDRVKGTEMFWNDPQGAEAILQLRSAALSDDDRLVNHLSIRPGSPYVRKTGKTEKTKCLHAPSPTMKVSPSFALMSSLEYSAAATAATLGSPPKRPFRPSSAPAAN